MQSRAWETADRPTITALITCYNEEKRIGSCIESLLWCDEILVVDSFSSDATVERARAFPKVQLIQHAYYGGAAQKNWAMQHVRTDWLLIFDSDEVCRPGLAAEIKALLVERPEHSAYTIHRDVYFLGKRIRYSGWQNDRVARLFKTGTARYADRRVHARLLTDGPAPMLEHSMDHFMVDSLDEYIRRTAKYSYWGAAQAYRDGVRAGWYQVLVRPAYRFLRTYLLQLGVLDGMRGLVFCMLQAAGTYMKWATLWGWQVNEQRGVRPTLPEFDDTEAAQGRGEADERHEHELTGSVRSR